MAAGTAARAARGGNSSGVSFADTINNAIQATQGSEAPGQEGLIGAGAGVAAPTPTPGAAPAAGASDPFAGQKFQLTPVQQKGRFSEKSKASAEGVYGSEVERNNSVKR